VSQFRNLKAVRSFTPTVGGALALNCNGGSRAYQLPANRGAVLLVNAGGGDILVRPGIDATIAVTGHGAGHIMVQAGQSVLLDNTEALCAASWMAVSAPGGSGLLVFYSGNIHLEWQQDAPDAGPDPTAYPTLINQVTGNTRQVPTAAEVAAWQDPT
jgi:hypothetical protein